MVSLGRHLKVLGTLILLSACASPASEPPPWTPGPGPSYPGPGNVVQLEVANIEVYPVAAADPNAALDLRDAVADWARSYLVPVGPSGRARVYINDAVVHERVLRTARSGTVRQYDGLIHVRVDVTDRGTQSAGFAGASASRSETAPYDLDPYERDRFLTRMADAMLLDLEQRLTSDIQTRLGRFIR